MIISGVTLTALGVALLHALGLGTAGALLSGNLTVAALLAGGHVARKALVIRVLHDLTKLNKLQGTQQCQCQQPLFQSQTQWQFPKWNWQQAQQPLFTSGTQSNPNSRGSSKAHSKHQQPMRYANTWHWPY